MDVEQHLVDEDEKLYVYTLRNGKTACDTTLTARLTNYGATLTHLIFKDKDGVDRDVVLGFDTVQDYKDGSKSGNQYFGCSIGRCANRIAKGQFSLNGQNYQLPINNGPNSLHGGLRGFDKQVWTPHVLGPNSVRFSLVSPHGDSSYPGSLEASVTYTLTGTTLTLTYSAHLLDQQPEGVPPDVQTIVNLTNHSYFNLSGGLEPTILQHRVSMAADRFVPIDETLIPTGKLQPVSEEPAMDFASGVHEVGERIANVPGGGGYDHCFVFTAGHPPFSPQLRVECASTGIALEMTTTEPGLQFYSGNFLTGEARSKASTQQRDGQRYEYVKHGGFCIEAEKFPDAINHPDWKDAVILSRGQVYQQTTSFALSHTTTA